MPEYLAPGVYVEETSFRQKSIEGVSTSTAGFVGAARFGPTRGEPELLTSFLDFERIYGGLDQLSYAGLPVHNDLAHSVRGFFENGGSRLYVARVFESLATADPASDDLGKRHPDHGVATIGGSPSDPDIALWARWPGSAGNLTVTFDLKVGPNVLVGTGEAAQLSGVQRWDTVVASSAAASPADDAALYVVDRVFDDLVGGEVDVLRPLATAGSPDDEASVADLTADGVDRVRVVTVTVGVSPLGRFASEQVWENLNPDPRHRVRAMSRVFADDPTDRATSLTVPLVIDLGSLADGATVVDVLLGSVVTATSPLAVDVADFLDQAYEPGYDGPPARVRLRLSGGSDGVRPAVAAFEGGEVGGEATGLRAFEDLEDISIVAAPGSSRDGLNGFSTSAQAIAGLLISHAQRMRYRVAVLDAPDRALASQVRGYRARFDSTHAALYYPWITIADPVTAAEIDVPPSGYMAGIFARTDVERGVHKAPANEVVRLAIDFETPVNKGQQDVLNPEGVNCLRFFEGRGFRVWGARTISSDPEWKYLNVRRYFAFIERSVERGTQWAVFEPNGPALWTNVRRTIEDFLFNEWRSGHLLGDTVQEAFFVRCDRSTMTQNDLDNGRLICLVGVAPLYPAEYVIFRIGQKTLDFKG